ncbi:hypothetical protein ACLOJK_007055 [Asimina triloba]
MVPGSETALQGQQTVDPLESHSLATTTSSALAVATSSSLTVATSSPVHPSSSSLIDTSTFQPRRRYHSSIPNFIFIDSYPAKSLLLPAKSFIDFLAIATSCSLTDATSCFIIDTTSSLVYPLSPSLADITSSSHLSSTS